MLRLGCCEDDRECPSLTLLLNLNMKSDLPFTKFGRSWKEYKIGETVRLLDHWKPRCIPVTGHSYNWNKKEDAKTSPANCMVTQRRGIAQLHEIR